MGPLHFGVQGAAVATIAAQAVSVILCLFYIIKNYPELHIKRDDLHVSPLLTVFWNWWAKLSSLSGSYR